MILFSHPTGNANVREALRALSDEGLLSEFWTSIYWRREHPLNNVLPQSVRRELNRRGFPHLRRHQVQCDPWLEVGRLMARHLRLSSLIRHEVGRFSIDAVYRRLDKSVAARLAEIEDISAIYAYEDGALASFRAARKLGIQTIYELPIGYWRSYRELMADEASLNPEWAVTLQGRGDSNEKLRCKDEELALATDIVVASRFVRGTLLKAGCLKAAITILPYGAPTKIFARRARNPRDGSLKVLFVGALSQRKGLSYLLQAVKRLGPKIDLTLVGHRAAECRALDQALQVHRWIPSLSHDAVLEEMSRHDVMVFPSLFEGFGLVILEAMSQGVPVITTPNTAAPDFLSDGVDGFIVPIRDVEAIVEKLELLMLDRDCLAAMSQAAVRKASLCSWEQYRHRVANTVRQAMTKGSQNSTVPEPLAF